MQVPPLYETDIKCLHCTKDFSTSKVRSKYIKVIKTDYDFMPNYAENSVIGYLYNVFVCEHCGFAFTEDFTTYFAPQTKEFIHEQITQKWVHHSFSGERTLDQAIQAYQLALLSGSIKNEKTVVLAGIALRIAWIYRLLKNEVQEQRFMRLAKEYYMLSYSNEDYNGSQMTDVRIMYLIAELSYRLGDESECVRFLSKVIEAQKRSIEPKIIEMAKVRWEEIRENREN